jgi:hypothetical protein
MSAIRKLIGSATSDTGQQALLFVSLFVILLILPLGLEHSSIPVRLGVLAILLPFLAIWVVMTPVTRSRNANGTIALDQWLRWLQYATVVGGIVWMQNIM